MLIDKCKSIAKEIYNDLGSGWSESVYHKAFEVALRLECIRYESHKITPIDYKGYNIGEGEIDLLAMTDTEKLIIEIKAGMNIVAENIPQIKKYMRTINVNDGLIINFPQEGKSKIECEKDSGLQFMQFQPSSE